jgi:hypothetical protein
MNDDKKLRLREGMIKEKLFLKNLYLGNPLSNKSTLSFATEFQLNVLIRVLFFIVSGQIPLKKIHYERLIKSKKRRVLHERLSNFDKLKNLIKSDREVKIKFLNIFLSLFSSLLFLVFNER